MTRSLSPCKSPPRTFRRFQYSIRQLLSFTLLCALACGFVAYKIRKANRQRNAAARLRESSADLYYDYQVISLGEPDCGEGGDIDEGAVPTEPVLLRELLGDDFFHEVVRVDLKTDAEMEQLESLPGLRRLSVDQLGLPVATLSDTGLRHIEGLTRLEVLDLLGSDITGAGLQYLEKLTRLRMLRLRGTAVSNAGISHLARLGQLEFLDLSETAITDAGLGHLSGLRRLKTLYVNNTSIQGAALNSLQGMTDLQDLNLSDTPLSRGLANLNGLSQLKELWIGATKIGDAELLRLGPLPQLETLRLDEDPITDAAIASVCKQPRLKNLNLRRTKITGSDSRSDRAWSNGH